MASQSKVGIIFSVDPSKSRVFESANQSSYISQQQKDLFGHTYNKIDYGGITSYIVGVTPEYVELIDRIHPAIINGTLPKEGKEFSDMIVKYFEVAAANYLVTYDVCHRLDLVIIDFILENLTAETIPMVDVGQLQTIDMCIDGEIIQEERFIFMKICTCNDISTIHLLLDRFDTIRQGDKDENGLWEEDIWHVLYRDALLFTFNKFGVSNILLNYLKATDPLLFKAVTNQQ